MVNEYALSTLHWFFLFPRCIMALEISHYFLPGAFEKTLCHSSQQSCTQKAFPTDLRLLGFSPGIQTLES